MQLIRIGFSTCLVCEIAGIRSALLSAFVALAFSGVLAEAKDQQQARAQFRQQVAPVLAGRCLQCHNSTDRKGDLSLESRQELLNSGSVVPGAASESRLMEVLIHRGDEPASMPKEGAPLTSREVASVREWIDRGAPWPADFELSQQVLSDYDWWSFKPLRRRALPSLPFGRNAIDRFVNRTLRQHGLTPSPEADRRTLIRRLTYDLIGLPPSPAESQAFVNDRHPLAYERLVDRLLASPRYGERWARHWLDVVKYADTCGYDKDKLRPNAWPYRDYVIRSFNRDKPYARFVQEQLAGDVLFPGERDSVLALGFLAAGPWDFIGHVEVPETKIDGRVARNLDRDEMVTNTFNTFASLTVQCARCHNHKFDPLTQQHYYNLQTLFAAVDRAERPMELSSAQEARFKRLTESLASARRQKTACETKIREQVGAEFATLNTRIAELQAKADEDSVAKRAELEAQRVELVARINPTELVAELEEHEQSIKAAARELKELRQGGVVYAAATHFAGQSGFRPTFGVPRMIHVLHRGNIQQPSGPARPGTVPLSGSSNGMLALPEDHTEGERRAALARWLVKRDHPLTWRSIVNRIWQHHFGRGIVDSPNDFGRMGQLPTHPEMLDWLAVEFRDHGQTMKRLHRLIVASRVYRQVSAHDASNAKIDDANRFLWRMNRRRISAEEIRDSILAVSGRLNLSMGGAGYYLFVLEKTDHSPHYEYHKFDPNDVRSHRRSVYRFIVRSQPDPFMTALDCADSSQSTPRRNETLTSLQALSLLNSRFNLAMSEHFAERITSAAATLPEQIDLATQLVAGRQPQADERRELERYAEQHGLPNLCRLMFNLNEFVYVD